jgi:mannose-6-phosphate isomerase-like protein (cupin superfamily)
MENEFPDFIKAMPRPDVETALDCYLSSGDRGLVMFYEAPHEDVVVPEHVHGEQWGIVLSGKVRMQIGNESSEYGRGETYFVPAGVPHVTWVAAGTRGLDVFEEHDRYVPSADAESPD